MSCVSFRDCNAVGYSFTGAGFSTPPDIQAVLGDVPLIEHFNGRQWTISSSPRLTAVLNSVSCVSATFCIAVGGSIVNNHEAGSTLVEQFDGERWRVVASPNLDQSAFQGTEASAAPPTTAQPMLVTSSCTSVSNCFAVGYDEEESPLSEATVAVPLSIRYGSGQWSFSPILGDSAEFSNLSCDQTICVAIGLQGQFPRTIPIAALFTQGIWSAVGAPADPDVRGLSCQGASCAAFGNDLNIFTFAHGSWSPTAVPNANAAREMLEGIDCMPHACVLVGTRAKGRSPYATFIERVGSRASVLTSPDVPRYWNGLFSVACPSSSECVAVGYAQVPAGGGSGQVRTLALAAGG